MKHFSLFLVALFCCMMHVQLNAQETYLCESNGIHYVLVAHPERTTVHHPGR